jgi:phosphoribosylformylglycinamidine cyclo-ligase
VKENLNRILPGNVDAVVDLGAYRVPEVFSVIRRESQLSDKDMLQTFNMGVGLIAVCLPDLVSGILTHLKNAGESAYVVGSIVKGTGRVLCEGSLEYYGA